MKRFMADIVYYNEDICITLILEASCLEIIQRDIISAFPDADFIYVESM